MTTLNGLPRTWDSFIQGIYARKKLVKFSRLWEECSQEEARIVAQEEKREMKINLSQYNPRKAEQTITKVSTLAKRKTLESITKICLSTFALHVMKEDTLQEIVP